MAYEFRGNTRLRQDQARQGRRPRPERVETAPSGGGRERSLAQVLALAFGVAFLLLGIAGFIPGVTQNYDQLNLFGTDSNAELFGVFRVSVLHNIAHLLFGVGVLAAASEAAARTYLLLGGIAYAGLGVFGLLIDHESDVNFLPVDYADSLLHVGLAVAMLLGALAAMAAARRTRPA